MKLLYIGDVHAEPSGLEECRKLINYVIEIGTANNVDGIVFLGDLYNTHALVNLFVFNFWQKSFERLCKKFKIVISLVGNHDKVGVHNSDVNSLQLHQSPNVIVVDKGYLYNGVSFVGYQNTEADFLKVCEEHPGQVLVCHQTFTGSQYENGFYAEDGFDLQKIPHKEVISGHIHTAQKFDKLWYMGSPRWRIVSDANVEKFIYVLTHAEDGTVEGVNKFNTSAVCTPIYQFKDSPDEPFDKSIDKANITIDLYGPVDYIKTRNEELKAKGYKVRTFPEKNFKSNVRESEGIRVAITKFTQEYTAKNGTKSTKLLNLLKKRLTWMAE